MCKILIYHGYVKTSVYGNKFFFDFLNKGPLLTKIWHKIEIDKLKYNMGYQ